MFGTNLGPGVGGNMSPLSGGVMNLEQPAYIQTTPVGAQTPQVRAPVSSGPGMSTNQSRIPDAPMPAFRSSGPGGQAAQRQQAASGNAGLAGDIQQAAKHAKTGKQALDLGEKALGGGPETTYGSGLSFSPDQISQFQESGLTSQAASGPESSVSSSSGSTVAGAGMAGLGSGIKHYIDTDNFGESFAKGVGTGVGALIGGAFFGPIGSAAGGFLSNLGINEAMQPGYDDEAPEIEPSIGLGPQPGQGAENPDQAYRQRVYDLADPKKEHNEKSVRYWSDALGIPMEKNTWTEEVTRPERPSGAPAVTRDIERSTYYLTEKPELTRGEYINHWQQMSEQGVLGDSEIIDAPGGGQVLYVPEYIGFTGGDSLYQSMKYPGLKISLDDFNNKEVASSMISDLEQQFDSLAEQGVDVNQALASGKYRDELKPSDKTMEDIASGVNKEFGFDIQLGPGVGGHAQQTQQVQPGLSVGGVGNVGSVSPLGLVTG